MKTEILPVSIGIEEQTNSESSEQKRVFFVSEHGYPYAMVSTLDIGSLVTTHLLGRVLTIVDASIADQRQCKATKDLIKQTMWDAFSEVRMWMCENAQRKDANYTAFPFTDNRSIEQ